MTPYTPEYRECLNRAGAIWPEHGGPPVHYGRQDHDYWSVRDGGLGVADCSDRETLAITGRDVIPWAQGLLTNDVMALEALGSGQRSFAVNRVGRLIADLRLLHLPSILMVDLAPGSLEGGLVEHLNHHIIMEDVEVGQVSRQVTKIGVFGHHGPRLLQGLVHGTHRRIMGLGEYEGTWGRLGGAEVVVQQVPWVGCAGFCVSCGREQAHLVWEALMGASDQVRPVGSQALEVMRREAGEPEFGKEMDEKVIPIEADLNRFISYEKGCYLGQEVIHRLDTQGRPAKMLRLLALTPESDLPAAGAKLLWEEKAVGSVLGAFRSPVLEGAGYALGYVKRPAYELGEEVEVEGVGRAKVLGIDMHRGALG